MLLRSITKHVKDQNWFAVGLDFFIVVVGVFMGFQLQEWAVAQKQLVAEDIYLERLHEEVIQSTANRDRVSSAQLKNNDALSRVVLVLQNQTERDTLTDAECIAIAESHIYSKLSVELPTLDELLSTGQINSLSHMGIKSAITQLNQGAKHLDNVINAVGSGNTPLADLFPDLIQLQTRIGGTRKSFTDMIATCDAQAMKSNQLFLNMFTDNRDRFRSYIEHGIIPPSENMALLHSELDKALGISHSEKDQN